MKDKKTSGYISWALKISLISMLVLVCTTAYGQEQELKKTDDKATQLLPDTIEVYKKEQMFLQGFSVYADVFGLIQKVTSDYGSLEGGLRVNLKNMFFPTVEMGYGICDSYNDNTYITYKTKAPYIRIGCDINMLKDKWQDNKLFLGLRYGLSTFKYDINGPEMTDPVWGGTHPFNYDGISSTAHWAEVVLGVQVKMWRNFHMGWSLRIKRAIGKGETDYGIPYFIPGYGTTTNSTVFGATYNLIFDLNWGKKGKRKHKSSIIISDEKTESQTDINESTSPDDKANIKELDKK